MADNFNLSKFIRNNPLLNESIGGYRDIEHVEEMASNNSMKGSLTLDWAGEISDLKAKCKKHGVKCKVITMDGPGGGWPEVNIMGTVGAIENWLKDDYAQDEEDLQGWVDSIEPLKEINYELEKPENIYNKDGMDYDDSPNPFPSLVSDEDDENETYGRAFGLAGQQLKSAIDALRQDGFDDEDIKNFLMTGIDMYDQVFGDYDNLEEAEGQFQSFDWNTVDQQGNKTRLVVDTGTNDAGEEVIRVGHPNTGGTLAMFTKDDILNNDGYLRVGGKNFQVQPSLINWAKS
jgi:hypothetical protein